MEENQQAESGNEYIGTSPIIVVGVLMLFCQIAQLWVMDQALNDYKFYRSSLPDHSQWEAQLTSQRMVVEVQKKVADACISKGLIPTFMGGNVDCKPLPK